MGKERRKSRRTKRYEYYKKLVDSGNFIYDIDVHVLISCYEARDEIEKKTEERLAKKRLES